MVDRYFIAKIGEGNRLASDYLDAGRSELNGKQAIPIYFEGKKENKEDFLNSRWKGNQKGDIENFFGCGEDRQGKYIVVIHSGKFRIFTPVEDIVFKESKVRPPDEDFPEGSWVKLLPVHQVVEKKLMDVPAVLAGMNANRYYSSGTFREIEARGNIVALERLLEKPISPPSDSNYLKDALLCLSSFEFETLIAKLFEEAGCFVPAYRGGNMQAVDIFARNLSKDPIDVAGIEILSQSGTSIQVKLDSKLAKPPDGVDWYISISDKEDNGCKGIKWLTEAIGKSDRTRGWLRLSLSWLPTENLRQAGLE